MSTYKEQLQGMGDKELLELHKCPKFIRLDKSGVKNMLLNLGRESEVEAELLHRLNEAERLRDMLKLARTHINIFTPMKHRNPELEVLIEQALTTPEGDNR